VIIVPGGVAVCSQFGVFAFWPFSACKGVLPGLTPPIRCVVVGEVCTPVLGTPASIIGSELPVYFPPALRSATSRCPKPSPDRSASIRRAASCVRVHQHIIPGYMSIPRRRSWPNGAGLCRPPHRRELPLCGVLRTSPFGDSRKFAKKVSNITHLGDAPTTSCLLPWLR